MAISVMLYHYNMWYSGGHAADSIISKLGIYAVAIFYILSGLSLSLAYAERLGSLSAAATYTVKRIFRIFPLFWFATSIHIAFQLIKSVVDSSYIFDGTVYEMLMNYSLLFGFFDPSGYIAVGAWSIGNEMVFYALFPVVTWLNTVSRSLLVFGWILSFLAFIYFSFIVLDSSQSLDAQWASYVSPFNQFFLFYSGVAIGIFCKNIRVPVIIAIAALLGLAALFYLMEGGEDQITLVAGFNRIGFAVISILFVMCVFLTKWYLTGVIGRLFEFFGEACYSIYLLHPLVSFPVIFIFGKLGQDLLYGYVLSFILTIFCSYLTYRFLEKPGMSMGKKVVSTIQEKLMSSVHQRSAS